MPIISRYVPVDLSGRRAVVVGASIAGLSAALELQGRGAEVVLVEADPAPDAHDPEDAFLRWSRRRVPQSRHSHVFLARLCNLMRPAHPDLYARLLAAGAVELRLLDFPPQSLGPITREPGDEDLATIGCRRTTFEWVLRRYVSELAGIYMLCGTTTEGLLAHQGDPPWVWGVRVAGDGRARTIAADLVIDASGRGSRGGDWLAAIGAPRPYERRSPSGVLYYTRFYRRRANREFRAPGREPTMADFGWIKYAIFPADNRTYSITFAAHLSEQRLKLLSNVEAFEALVRALPGIAAFVDPELADPLPVLGREVLAMGGLENCMRRFVDRRGEPLAANFFVVGDAAYHTNPLYGRGTSQAFMHARFLGEALDATAGDTVRAARFLDATAREEIEPFYRASVTADGHASRQVGAEPASVMHRVYDSFFEDGVIPATRVDAIVFRAFVRMMNMLETPERAFFRPEVVERVLAVWMRGPGFRRRYAPTVPHRERTIAALEAVVRGDGQRAALG
jgi:2-polyprenyl-6-methoxyphenol hydroxylase-like FAD-dependent oxidoreductase